ncbi:DUF3560 domain-containing protein [Loktanella sp. S4079]|uniref:DUF3560 domain-containing protein n=1 Tax=Loktanella sp. S4079 TaxID=579483 RepID=UPI0005FA4040|nr:DUF3560 domain-containing protein [Loktanella sp. S4079]KJZ17910.1 hypothetical protein TW80_16350 [Loktanella sp. S4079]
MNSYEQKQARRKQRLLDAAKKQDAKAQAAYNASDMSENATGIPFGQPILVGHHSERRHRKAIERAHRAMDRCVSHSKRAEDLRTKADAVGQGGISSDDPEAIEKLKARVADLELSQENMKAANKIIRTYRRLDVNRDSTGPDTDAYLSAMSDIASHFDEAVARRLIDPDQRIQPGFPSYSLQNNNAKIKRLKDRIAELEKAAEQETKRHVFAGICDVVENVEINRLQSIFEGKPDASTRQILKDHAFRWAPSQNAWQRQLTNAARHSANMVIRALRESNA